MIKISCFNDIFVFPLLKQNRKSLDFVKQN